MFWRRATPWAGFWGLAAGTLAAVAVHFLHSRGPLDLGSPLSADFWGAVAAFVVDAVVTVVVSLFTRPKPDRELHGLVWELTETGATPPRRTRPSGCGGAARSCSGPSPSP